MSDVLKPLNVTPPQQVDILGPRTLNKKEGPACPPKPKERIYRKGLFVWIYHPVNVWAKTTIVKIPRNGKMVVQHSNGQEEIVKVTGSYPLLCGVSSEWKQLEDLTKLNPLHEPAVLQCLYRRCQDNQYCTKAGITLVSINPFKEIPGLYDADVVNRYRNNDIKDLPPHVFAVAEHAFTSMSRGIGCINQSIVVSGESGAGKTWTACCLMKYLASVAVPFNPGGFKPSPADCVEKRILDSNPLLEAFGNASTLRNDNSSRFGKYIQLQFDRGHHIIGASIQTYLLEKTRVVHQAERECNFHIFYQLIDGSTVEEQESLGLRKPGSDALQCFSYLHTTPTNTEYCLATTRNAMHNVGISTTKQQQMFQVLCGILHVGNVCFISDDDMEPCDINEEDAGCEHSLEFASQLLGLDSAALVKSILFRQITASHGSRRKSVFMRPCTVEEANSRRDCLAKLIYSRLFDWLVSSINSTTCAGKWHSFVGLLDIYGFESFHSNSLEQLCINYANEKLQQHFVTHFLRSEQDEYKMEGIPWTFCNFTDNRPCLDTIEGKPGVFTLINEECSLNRQSKPQLVTQRVLDTLKPPYVCQPHRSIEYPGFVIKHYAEAVTYNVEGLIEKNKDHIPSDLLELLGNSNNSFVGHLVQMDIHNSQKQKSSKPTAKTVVTKFKLSLDSLMSTLNSTVPHYIRCIKPNVSSQPDVFDAQHIVSQLRACGVIETITISASGFPTKLDYVEFWQRYRVLARRTTSNGSTSTINKSQCADIIASVFGDEGKENGIKQAIFGKTKIFLPDGQLEQLECARADAVLESVKTLQRAWRKELTRRDVMVKQWAATTIQATFRGWKARCYVDTMQDAARVIQHFMIMYSIRRQELSEEKDRQEQEEEEEEIQYIEDRQKQEHTPLLPETPVIAVTVDQECDLVGATNDSITSNSTLYKTSGFSQSTSPILCMPHTGYPHRVLHSGIGLPHASLTTHRSHSQLSSIQGISQDAVRDNGYFDEIDGDDDDDDDVTDKTVSSSEAQYKDSTMNRIFKMSALEVGLAVTVGALLVTGPISF